jgi:hypothetical protein
MELAGPGDRRIEILWDKGIGGGWGFTDQRPALIRNIPLTIAGHASVLADYQLYENGVPQGRGAFLTGLPRTIDGRTVGFDARCDPDQTSDTTYSWCVAILSSWTWGSGAS